MCYTGENVCYLVLLVSWFFVSLFYFINLFCYFTVVRTLNMISTLLLNFHEYNASMVPHTVQNLPAMRESWVESPGWEDPLEEGMATQSSILAWRSPWTEEPDGLHRVTNSWTWLSDWSQHNDCRNIVEQSIHEAYSLCLTESLYLWSSNSPFPHFLSSWKPLFHYKSHYYRYSEQYLSFCGWHFI